MNKVRVVVSICFLLITAWSGWQWFSHSRGANMLDQANKLADSNDPASLQKAIPLYQQAAAKFDTANEHLNEGSCYYNIARVYRKLHQNAPALEADQKALSLYSSPKPSDSDDADWDKKAKGNQADTLLNMGVIYKEENKTTEALDSFRQAQQLYTEVGNTPDANVATGNLAVTYLDDGLSLYKSKQWSRALKDFQQAQSYYHQAGNNADEAISWHDMGLTYVALNQIDKAADAIKQEKLLQATIKKS